MADQTEYALCTSTGPGPWHLGQGPECTRRARSATAASGILSATVRYRPRARHLSLQKRKSPRRLPPNRMVVPQELQVATRALLIGSTRPADGWRLGCGASARGRKEPRLRWLGDSLPYAARHVMLKASLTRSHPMGETLEAGGGLASGSAAGVAPGRTRSRPRLPAGEGTCPRGTPVAAAAGEPG